MRQPVAAPLLQRLKGLAGAAADNARKPIQALGPHIAALGMVIYQGASPAHARSSLPCAGGWPLLMSCRGVF